MARIPDSFIDDLLAKTDIVEVVGAHVQLKRAGREYEACCPFHEEKTPSFTVSPAKQFYHCFGCGKHGNAIQFLMEHVRLDFLEAVEQLAAKAGMQVPRTQRQGPGMTQLQALYAACAAAEKHFASQLQASPEAAGYVASRGLDAEACATFGIGYAPQAWDGVKASLQAAGILPAVQEQAGLLSKSENGRTYDKFRGRLMFPIHDARGRVIAFGGRALGDATPKYLNSPETQLFHKGRELYGLWHVRQANAKISRLLVVEGYMDVIALFQHGLPQAVATLGTATTDEQAALMFRYTDDVVFCFDGDRAGSDAAWKAVHAVLPQMKQGRQVGFLFLPDGQDPDSLVRTEGGEEFARRVDGAVPLSTFLFERLGQGLNLQSIEGRARLAERAKPLLDLIPAGAFRELMWQHLSELTGLNVQPASALKAEVRGANVSPRKSLVRTAITLLLHQPPLAGAVAGTMLFDALRQPGVELLADLVQLVQAEPEIQTDAILARFADRPEAEALRTLAGLQLDSTPHAQCAEFLDVIGKLDRLARRRRIEALQAQELLSDDDKRELRDLLAAQRAPRPRRRAKRGPEAPRTLH